MAVIFTKQDCAVCGEVQMHKYMKCIKCGNVVETPSAARWRAKRRHCTLVGKGIVPVQRRKDEYEFKRKLANALPLHDDQYTGFGGPRYGRGR